jgi:hypothetical protein
MKKNFFYLLSFIVTLFCSFIPAFGVTDTNYLHLFGFPTQVFGFSETGVFQFQWLGFILNFFVFHFFLLTISRISSILFKRK